MPIYYSKEFAYQLKLALHVRNMNMLEFLVFVSGLPNPFTNDDLIKTLANHTGLTLNYSEKNDGGVSESNLGQELRGILANQLKNACLKLNVKFDTDTQLTTIDGLKEQLAKRLLYWETLLSDEKSIPDPNGLPYSKPTEVYPDVVSLLSLILTIDTEVFTVRKLAELTCPFIGVNDVMKILGNGGSSTARRSFDTHLKKLELELKSQGKENQSDTYSISTQNGTPIGEKCQKLRQEYRELLKILENNLNSTPEGKAILNEPHQRKKRKLLSDNREEEAAAAGLTALTDMSPVGLWKENVANTDKNKATATGFNTFKGNKRPKDTPSSVATPTGVQTHSPNTRPQMTG